MAKTMATPNSRPIRGALHLLTSRLLLACLLLWSTSRGWADGGAVAGNDTETTRAQRLYKQAQEAYAKAPDNIEAAWHLGRACFDWAELAKTNAARAAIAEEGIAACRHAVERKWGAAAAHYYLGLNLGQLARTKSLGALKIVRELEESLKTTREIDPLWDYAGADRTLGLLYRDAPGWPTSVGSRTKSRQHLQKAVELAPAYPDNRLCLLESQLVWNERKQTAAQLDPTEKCLSDARAKFTGAVWQASWKDWDQRWANIKTKASGPASTSQSPKGKH